MIWFGSGKTRLKVTVNDPTIEVTFRGSQLSIKDGASQVDVEPGDQELTIRVAGVEFQTPKFSLKKGTTSVVEVERAEDKLAVNLAGTELAAWPIERALPPMPPAKASPPQLAAAPVGSPLRYFGFSILGDGANVARVANYANFLVDACWRTAGGETVLVAARQAKVPVLIGIQNASPDTVEKLDATIDKYPETVAGVIWEWPYFQGHTPDEVAAFGRAFKGRHPGRQFWITMVEEPLGKIETRPVPPEVDGFQVFLHYVTNPDQFREKADRFLPGFILKANGRPVVLGWNVFDNNAPGLAARTQPGTMAAAVEIAKAYKLAGVQYAHLGDEPGYHVLGIQTNPALMTEIEAVARTLGFNPSSNSEDVKRDLDAGSKTTERTVGNGAAHGQSGSEPNRDVTIEKPPQSPSAAEWTGLFNGRDLTGWTAVGVQGWRVEDGVLIGETQTDPGWLMTNAEHDNFELDFEYRLAAGANSGVFLRSSLGPVNGRDWMEIQVLDESDKEYRQLPAFQRTGALFQQLDARPLTELRPNEWYRMNIAIFGEELRVQVNGQEVTRGKIPTGKPIRGHVGLQMYPQGKPQRCEFRKLRLRPLKEGLPTEPAIARVPEETHLKAPADEPEAEKAGAPSDREPREVRHGLKAEFFEGRNFERKVSERIEPSVECFWELGAPAPEAPIDNFSVRFTGWLRAPKAGRYKLYLASKDGSRLKLNNQTIIDNWNPQRQTTDVSLELTQDPQPIVVEAFNADQHSWVSLLWQPTGTPAPCHIPNSALFPDLTSAGAKAGRSNAERTGLVADYYDKTFRRKLATDRVYRIEELWGPYSPRWGLPSDSAVRYSGILVPPSSGNYKLIAGARDHLRVWIDDKPTLEARGMKAGQTAVVELVADKAHEIRVEVVTATHGAHYLHWIPPQSTKEVSIPPECLFPNKAAVRQAKGPRDMTAIPADPPAIPGAGEWIDLFNGRDLTGWEVVNTRGVLQTATDGGWPVSSGVLRCDTGDDGWLRSTEDYEDFELELEFQTTASANGGILIRTRDSAASPADGLEIDLHSSAAGGIASVVTPSESHLRPVGEWNQLKVRATGLKYVVDLNGQRAADTDLASHPRAFKLHPSGRIGIYNYKGLARDMAFRNIRIQRLKRADKPAGRIDSTPP